ncbi:MAG TPA: adenylate/guanylate cyclase domain-containing protein [Geminicoccaceae bacterium]|jgi:adenylate cyclase|nr:adenylate/guanylate cyclase domain-containing protein [Geminicoccaceae bacterium]
MRLSLRQKLLLFAVAIAILPLIVAGRTMIRIAQDELKSSANEQLVVTSQQLVDEINDLYERTWLAPLLLIRNALDDPRLGIEQKISLLTMGITDIPDIVALQITVEGAALPMVVVKDDFAARLKEASLDPLEVLRVPAAVVEVFRESGDAYVSEVRYIPQSDDWLATVVLPMQLMLGDGHTSLSARIDLEPLKRMIQTHPFTRTGFITIIDAEGQQVFDPARTDLTDHDIVAEAVGLLTSGARLISVEPYRRPDGEVMLGAFAFPRPFEWAVIVEKRQREAYLAIEKMLHSLGLWVIIGLAVAVAGAIALALRISRPILKIERVASEVAQGNFRARVEGVRSRDEIGDLAKRMNDMVVGLNERFQLAKFVSGGTLAAIKLSDYQGVRLGGERRLVTMVFCDIRGYTAFAERHDPEVVVEVLNLYFQHLAELVVSHGGDIDKYVGDQIIAVFQGEDMVANAVRCALAMQRRMTELGRQHPDWDLAIGIGINTGEVVMGAMGSRERMDYTVLGDHVNLAARLCAQAGPGQTLLSHNSYQAIAGLSEFAIAALTAIAVRGKSEPVVVYQVGVPAAHPASASHTAATSA